MPDGPPPSPIRNLSDVLRAAGARPPSGATIAEKNAYAGRFANAMATCIANGLRHHFPGILPDERGRGAESPARAVRGPKKLDVNYSTPQLGLGLGLSLKSVHIRETGGGRGYTHNMKRNDEELRVEASGYHARQPYAVMVGVLFLPYDACDDARDRNPSSFGKWVRYLRPLAGRRSPSDDIVLFERIFIGLYDTELGLYDPPGTGMEFFDVEQAPPRRGRPQRLIPFQGFVAEVRRTYDERNHSKFEWADETPPPYGEPT